MSQTREAEEENELSMLAMTLAAGPLPSFVLKAIVELDVLEIIKKAGPSAQLSAAQVAAQLPTGGNPDSAVALDRMLCLLASFSLLTFSLRPGPDPEGGAERVYGLTPVCRFFTKDEDGVCFAPTLLLHHDKVLTDVWNNLKSAVLEGGVPFKQTHGMSFFEYLGTDHRLQEVFNQGKNNHATLVLRKILETYKGFEGVSSLVDVLGGAGDALKMIVSKYPTIKGINFDLPHVVQTATPYPGVEHVGGDMYVSIPAGDAIFVKWILHATNDEQCLRLLKNCYTALPEHGKLILCEYVAPDAPGSSHSAKMAFALDAIMLALPGGRERTEREYQALGEQAGFEDFHVASYVCNSCIMNLLKKKKKRIEINPMP